MMAEDVSFIIHKMNILSCVMDFISYIIGIFAYSSSFFVQKAWYQSIINNSSSDRSLVVIEL